MVDVAIYGIGGNYPEQLIARVYSKSALLLLVNALFSEEEPVSGVSLHGTIDGETISGECSWEAVEVLCR